MTWSLVTYRWGDATAVAVLRADGTLVAPLDLKRWPTMLELLEDWRRAEGILRGHGDTVFDRDIDFRGQRFTERITLEAPHPVVFTRIAGPVLGIIANEIEGPDDDLRLRFSFALAVAGGSVAEQEYGDSMTGDYLKAVEATLNAMRRLAAGAPAVSA